MYNIFDNQKAPEKKMKGSTTSYYAIMYTDVMNTIEGYTLYKEIITKSMLSDTMKRSMI